MTRGKYHAPPWTIGLAAALFIGSGVSAAMGQQQTITLPSNTTRIYSAGPGQLFAWRSDGEADFVNLQSGEINHVALDGEITAFTPFRASDGSNQVAAITIKDGKYGLYTLDSKQQTRLADVVPTEFFAPDLVADVTPDGTPSLIIWDSEISNNHGYYRRVTGDRFEDIKTPSFTEFFNFGDDVLLSLQPSLETAELLVNGTPEDSINFSGLAFSSRDSFASFVPSMEDAGTGKIAIANGETETLTVLAREEARLPRIGLPTQASLKDAFDTTGRRMMLGGNRDLSLLLFGEAGSSKLSTLREIEVISAQKQKGSPSSGGLEIGGVYDVGAPIKDFALVRGADGEDLFAFLYDDDVTLVIAPVAEVAAEAQTSVDPSSDAPFVAGADDPESVMRLQKALASLGFSIGAVDGMLGPSTNGAIRSFQVGMGLEASGSFDADTAAALNTTLDDRKFSSPQEALGYFSSARLKPIIGDAPERYRHVSMLVPTLYNGGYHNRNALAALLAHIIYETSNLRILEEPKRIGEIYQGRLGNTAPGDGERYRGRGYLMIVGKTNYQNFGKLVGVDLVAQPELVLEPRLGAEVALSIFRRQVPPGSIETGYVNLSSLQKRLNGGTRGMTEVTRIYRTLLQDPVSE